MGGGEIVEAPDGKRWRVRRRWLERPGPKLGRQFRAGIDEATAGAAPDGGLTSLLDGPLTAIAGAVLLFLLIVVLLPLLGVALEIVALIFVLSSGVIGRVALGKPWWVEAVPVGGDVEQRGVYAVRGWRASREAVRELATAIRASGEPPPRLAHGRRLATRPAGSAAAGFANSGASATANEPRP